MPRIIDTEESTNKLFFCFRTALQLLEFNKIGKELEKT
jgi:hypothetical protein